MSAQPEGVVKAADGVYFVGGAHVNWVILEEGDDLTLIDAGYPGDADAVEGSIRHIGHRPEDVRAVLVTHAHVDHIGSLPRFTARYGTPVYTDPREVAHTAREYIEQATPGAVLSHLWRPGVASWTLHVLRSGGTSREPVRALPFPDEGPLDLPGRPVPVPTPGHTSGHSCYHLPSVGAVVTGDSLCTGHAISRLTGPQVLPSIFHHDRDRMLAALDTIAGLDADLLLPGHGPLTRTPTAEAVRAARAGAARTW
ncbi:MBL fold metallo-hydrolase [Nocardiopsis sp. FIRDI 009]|uniref:MBL fold metallo-hydrolase n=1 Tax=Nocardiopsis sp. FIRDI 009 TaxID=714197 RepID=UPI000E22B5A0|nr:MBL fold metallo-hydrolase [Nocardiopsis sp. FIRDI 009]